MEVIDHDLQDHFGYFHLELEKIWLVHAIISHRYGLQSPNSHQTCMLGYSQLLLKMEVIDLDLQDHLAIILIQETAFSVALVYWSRPGRGVLHILNMLLFFYLFLVLFLRYLYTYALDISVVIFTCNYMWIKIYMYIISVFYPYLGPEMN